MNFWDILGVAPSTNQRFIKKAYRLQLTAQKANNAGLNARRQLEQAYHQAMIYAGAKDFTQPMAKKPSKANTLGKMAHQARQQLGTTNQATVGSRRNAGKQQGRSVGLTLNELKDNLKKLTEQHPHD